MAVIFETLSLDVAAVAISLVAVLFAFIKWKFTYWERRNVQTLPITFPLGNIGEVFAQRKQFTEIFKDAYLTFKAKGLKHCGIYTLWRPIYVPVDVEIIKHVIQKDFHIFVNRGAYYNEKHDPLSAHLVFLEDAKWKNLRAKLTPTFTSSRMKAMFQTLVDCGKELTLLLEEYSKGKALDIKDVLGRYTTDVIGSCAFGIDCNTLKNPDSEFREYGKKAFEFNIFQNISGLIQQTFPRSLLNHLGMKVVRQDVSKFFMNIVKQTVDYRENNNVHRRDFMHLLLQLKNRGKLTDDGKIFGDGDVSKETTLTMNELSAQAFVFFAAGFETSSTAMTWALYELATNPDVQQKLRDEIRDVMAKHGNELTYEALNEMKYMDMVINETLRKYPPLAFLSRVCKQKYKVPGTDLVLEKGTGVFVSLLGLHNDPEYFPEPESFKPERFSEENRSKWPAFAFLPFGEGPRNCIGMRFGLMQTKVGLAALLRDYRVSLNEKTETPVVIDPTQFIITAKGGIWLNVEKM